MKNIEHLDQSLDLNTTFILPAISATYGRVTRRGYATVCSACKTIVTLLPIDQRPVGVARRTRGKTRQQASNHDGRHARSKFLPLLSRLDRWGGWFGTHARTHRWFQLITRATRCHRLAPRRRLALAEGGPSSSQHRWIGRFFYIFLLAWAAWQLRTDGPVPSASADSDEFASSFLTTCSKSKKFTRRIILPHNICDVKVVHN